ncbi:MAG: TIGR04283 family arsenosugar biosynthesis glycosyltransferase [Porticoccus sp.]|jgi:rSAM/selenodomain-associated transferase 2|uniref:TIGR04283 family arsenosugar biosynthesis glycosyltransferase n=1 Tax=Porticoccus sp. TaxID=2024853 RepID=UPI000C5CDCD0|nr:TIGR04283 family arsenosugar biosynthesis glycosyltransferase [Porticoccus sp.]MAZ70309.1 glycosyl transferase [Porticoccus sp.]|tara:strand:+ start:4218 stop:4892 length:675 start_codon:yes stop_codon:yes gene_type:complete
MAGLQLSIVIPVLNEGAELTSCLQCLQGLRQAEVELIVVDGGSSDDSVERATAQADLVINSPRGRSLQMNAGAVEACGNYLLFLHSDTRLPVGFSSHWLSDSVWGFFPVKLSGTSWAFRVIERAMSCRARFSGIGTGDQALFVRRDIFDQIGGFAAIPLMEDVEICRRLKVLCPPKVLSPTVLTSARRWQQRGIVSTVLQMWWLRLAFFLGVSPARLARRYYPE